MLRAAKCFGTKLHPVGVFELVPFPFFIALLIHLIRYRSPMPYEERSIPALFGGWPCDAPITWCVTFSAAIP